MVKRCGDIVFRDSAHYGTSYHYKLSAITGIDSEGKSRVSILTLNLHEDMESCMNIFRYQKKAFYANIPSVVFSDRDREFSGAIRSLGYSDDLNHLLCTYHLFDVNVKRKVSSSIQASVMTSR